MKILVFGAGAIGTYIGGSLALAGEDVTFLDRPEIASRLLETGLKLGLPGGEQVIPSPKIATSLKEAFSQGEFDLAVLAVKGFDTASILETVKPYLQKMPPVVCFQNGVENEPAIAAVLGDDRVIRGTVTTAIGRRGLGDILVERFRGTGIELNLAISHQMLEACNRAGLGMQGFTDGNAMKWSKMLTNLMGNATSAILNWPPAQVYAHPGLFDLERRQLREVLAVMDDQRIPVVDLPGTPVKLLALALRYLPSWLSQPLITRAVGGGRGAKMPSFHIDLYQGRGHSEVDWLNGAVVRAAKISHLSAPVNALLCDVLTRMTNGDLKKEDFAGKPEMLLSRLNLS